MIQQPFEVADCVGNTLQKMLLALIQPPKAVGTQYLYTADKGEAVILFDELLPINGYKPGGYLNVVVEKLESYIIGDIGFGLK